MRCRYCAGETGAPVMELGPQPLANSFLTADELRDVEAGRRTERRVPLDLHVCEACGLVQIADSPTPDELFSEYLYLSGTSDFIHRHAASLADSWRPAGDAPFVVEIASNDGTVLQAFRKRGCRVLGVEPAANVAAVAREQGIDTCIEFFGAALGRELRERYGPADCVLARHVFAHVPDAPGFLSGVRALLAAEGRLLVEAPYAAPMLARTEFDTIYHEHLTYLAVAPVARLLQREGLELIDVRPYEIHGGSLLYVIGHTGRGRPGPAVGEALAHESSTGLGTRAAWEAFGTRAREVAGRLRVLLGELRADGARLAAYGAPAKGNTLLGYTGIGRETLAFLADRSPWKQGRYSPGTHIPVRGPEALLAERPEYVLLLAWNFEPEILEQQREYRRGGGRFIRPIPWPEVIA
jgi:SAM-dependent methyltransferase